MILDQGMNGHAIGPNVNRADLDASISGRRNDALNFGR